MKKNKGFFMSFNDIEQLIHQMLIDPIKYKKELDELYIKRTEHLKLYLIHEPRVIQ